MTLVYKYRTLQRGIEALEKGELWFSSVLGFNDPFDGQWSPMWQIELPVVTELMRTRLRSFVDGSEPLASIRDVRARLPIAKYRLECRGLESDGLGKKIDALLEDNTAGNPLANWLSRVNDLLQRTRILSTSKPIDSLLLWSHYADGHRGIALGFEPQSLAEVTKTKLVVVDYVDELPPLYDVNELAAYLIGVCGLPRDALPRATSALERVKAKAWDYEQEVRFGAPLLGVAEAAGDARTFGNSLREVVLGVLTPPNEAERIKSIVTSKYPLASLRRAVRSQTRFGIDIIELK